MDIHEALRNAIETEYTTVKVLKESNRSRITLLRHNETGKPCVLRQFSGDGEAYCRLKQVECKHLPRVLEVEETDGQVVVLEEYVQGDNLGELLEGGLFSVKETEQTAKEILAGLQVLHSLGVVHRDVKPENVILRESGAVLIDFDASRVYKTSQTSDTHILGTTGYAAPEQFGVAQTDDRADIYAMGVLMNMMLTGGHPSKTMAEGRMGKIISKCTMMDPGKRYKNVEQLRRALEKKQYRAALPIILGVLLLGVLAISLLQSKASPELSANSPMPSPAISEEPERSPEPEVGLPPSPSPTPVLTEAEAVYEDGDGIYRLFLCFDAGVIPQHISQADRMVELPPDVRTGCPSILTVYKEGSSEDVTAEFAAKVQKISVEAIPTGDGTPMELTDVEVMGEFIGAFRMVSISMWTENQENTIRWSLKMTDGQEITLAQKLRVIESASMVITPDNVDMSTLEQLQQVIDFVGDDAGAGATIDIYLPPVIYEGELNISRHGVNLYGDPGGTTFRGSVVVNTPEGERVQLQDISFEGQGGTGITASAPVTLLNCSLSGYDIGAAAYDGGFIIAHSSAFRGNGVAIHLESPRCHHVDVGYFECLFENNGTAMMLLAIDSDATMIFPGTVFAGNTQNINNPIDYPVDMSEAVMQ